MARYQVGIDLGTTNSALAYLDRQAKGADKNRLTTFPVAQLVGPGDLAALPLLPSFLYIPGPHELPADATALPWNPAATVVVGAFARSAGGKIPGRLVSSAKSWLCHADVDRTAPLLPWGAPPDAIRVSPLEASTKYLAHLVAAWNHAPGRAPADRLEEQPVTLTVPASFDDSARTLTAEAAKLAGLKHVTLLEEPQAAFYAWLGTHTAQEAGRLKPGMRCLVVDVGGGTTDLSLIAVGEGAGELTFERDAVGEHLLLGGDNMDLALAKFVEAKLPGGRLEAGQFLALVQACRSAKEALLGDSPPAEFAVTVVGRGRGVVAGTVSIPVTRADIDSVILDGFFPAVGFDESPRRTTRGGLQELGLPYVEDAAVPRHLAAFLRAHLPEGTIVDAVLFNGGVFTPAALRVRVISVMRPWFTTGNRAWEPLVLTSPSLDLAVAWGAAYSGQLRQTGGRRIGGGIPRSYYLELAADAPEGEVPVVCVVPRSIQEGEEVVIEEPVFQLTLGQPALFPIYSSTARGDDRAGDVHALKRNQLLALPPLFTVLRGGKRAGVKQVPVTLAAKCTEIGTLELYCVSTEGNRWKLEFNVRDAGVTAPGDPATVSGTVRELFPEEKIAQAAHAVTDCYVQGRVRPGDLPRALEAALGLGRADWPTSLCRRLWDEVAEVAPQRSRSPEHLSRWYNLAGFLLRPGTGDSLDKYRVDSLWKLIHAASSQAGAARTPNAGEGGADYWILWRRVAGGLHTPLQQQLWARLKPVLLGTGKAQANELAEMWRAAASFERLDARIRAALGEQLLKNLANLKKRNLSTPPYAFWSLTRLGTRKNFTGPVNTIVHPDVAERWVQLIWPYQPEEPVERKNWAFALAQLARRTGNRSLDVSDEVRATVAKKLRMIDEPAWAEFVEEVKADTGEAARLFGERLPLGLTLAG